MNSVDSVVDGILNSSGQWVFPLAAVIIWLKYCGYSLKHYLFNQSIPLSSINER